MPNSTIKPPEEGVTTSPKFIDQVTQNVAGILAIGVTTAVLITIILPYVSGVPEQNHNLIVQGQTTIWNGWLLILGYYYGSTRQRSQLDDTANTQARTVDKLTIPTPTAHEGKVVLQPGDEVNVEAEANRR